MIMTNKSAGFSAPNQLTDFRFEVEHWNATAAESRVKVLKECCLLPHTLSPLVAYFGRINDRKFSKRRLNEHESAFLASYEVLTSAAVKPLGNDLYDQALLNLQRAIGKISCPTEIYVDVANRFLATWRPAVQAAKKTKAVFSAMNVEIDITAVAHLNSTDPVVMSFVNLLPRNLRKELENLAQQCEQFACNIINLSERPCIKSLMNDEKRARQVAHGFGIEQAFHQLADGAVTDPDGLLALAKLASGDYAGLANNAMPVLGLYDLTGEYQEVDAKKSSWQPSSLAARAEYARRLMRAHAQVTSGQKDAWVEGIHLARQTIRKFKFSDIALQSVMGPSVAKMTAWFESYKAGSGIDGSSPEPALIERLVKMRDDGHITDYQFVACSPAALKKMISCLSHRAESNTPLRAIQLESGQLLKARSGADRPNFLREKRKLVSILEEAMALMLTGDHREWARGVAQAIEAVGRLTWSAEARMLFVVDQLEKIETWPARASDSSGLGGSVPDPDLLDELLAGARKAQKALRDHAHALHQSVGHEIQKVASGTWAVGSTKNEVAELKQSINIGISKAALRYDPRRSISGANLFAAFAVKSSKQAVKDYRDSKPMITVPKSRAEDRELVASTIEELEAEGVSHPCPARIAERSGLKLGLVKLITSGGAKYISIDETRYEPDEGSNDRYREQDLHSAMLASAWQESDDYCPVMQAQREEIGELVRKLISHLPEREQSIIRAKMSGDSSSVIGARYNVSRQRVQQIMGNCEAFIRAELDLWELTEDQVFGILRNGWG